MTEDRNKSESRPLPTPPAQSLSIDVRVAAGGDEFNRHPDSLESTTPVSARFSPDDIASNPNVAVRNFANLRRSNADSFVLFELPRQPALSPVLVLAIADGIGGHAFSQRVSQTAIQVLQTIVEDELTDGVAFVEPDTPAELTDQLGTGVLKSLHRIHGSVLRLVEENRWGEAGSTIVLAVICDNLLIVTNLGDSPLYHFTPASGRLEKVTIDHTVANSLLNSGALSADEVRRHPTRNVLRFFLGGAGLPSQPPIYFRSLSDADLVLLCSDGVTANLSESDIVAILADRGASLDRLADRLLSAAQARGETDNQTLILWRHTASEVGGPAESVSPLPKNPASAADAVKTRAVAANLQQDHHPRQGDAAASAASGARRVGSNSKRETS